MPTWLKMTLSILGTFLSGVTTAYTANPMAPNRTLLMAGLVPVGAYLVGFAQINPALDRAKLPEGKP